MDYDFLYLADFKELVDLIKDKYATICVQHDYAPKETTIMDRVVQIVYPRKNWSAMVLYNYGHPKNKILTFVWNFLERHWPGGEHHHS